MTKRKIEYWVIPPEQDAEFVAFTDHPATRGPRPAPPARSVVSGSSLVADVALVPLLARTDGRRGKLAGAAVVGVMVAKRLAGNAPAAGGRKWRTYISRLVLDRDDPAAKSEP